MVEGKRDWVTRTATARWIVSMAMILLGTLFWHQEICRDEAALVGSEPSVRLCGEPAWSDRVPVYLLALLVLWPDLSEFGIAGVTAKRRIEQQERRIQELAGQLQQVNVTVQLAQAAHSIEDREALATPGEIAPEPEPDWAAELHDVMSEIDTWLGVIRWPGLTPEKSVQIRQRLSDPETQAVSLWASMFDREIAAVRAAYESFQFEGLTQGQAREAVAVARKLLEILRGRLEMARTTGL